MWDICLFEKLALWLCKRLIIQSQSCKFWQAGHLLMQQTIQGNKWLSFYSSELLLKLNKFLLKTYSIRKRNPCRFGRVGLQTDLNISIVKWNQMLWMYAWIMLILLPVSKSFYDLSLWNNAMCQPVAYSPSFQCSYNFLFFFFISVKNNSNITLIFLFVELKGSFKLKL